MVDVVEELNPAAQLTMQMETEDPDNFTRELVYLINKYISPGGKFSIGFISHSIEGEA